MQRASALDAVLTGALARGVAALTEAAAAAVAAVGDVVGGACPQRHHQHAYGSGRPLVSESAAAASGGGGTARPAPASGPLGSLLARGRAEASQLSAVLSALRGGLDELALVAGAMAEPTGQRQQLPEGGAVPVAAGDTRAQLQAHISFVLGELASASSQLRSLSEAAGGLRQRCGSGGA